MILAVSYYSIDLFAMITGYLYIDREKFRYMKIVKYWGIAIFYVYIITIVLYLCNPTMEELGDEISWIKVIWPPAIIKYYWYLISYTLLFFLIPYINRLMFCIDQKSMKRFLLTLFVLLSVVPTVFMTDFFMTSLGYSPWWLIYCYMIGAYIKRYGMRISNRKQIVLMVMCFSISILAFYLLKIGVDKPIDYAFELYAPDMFYWFTSPTTVICATIIMNIFGSHKRDYADNSMGARVLKSMSSAAFSVYLIHCEPYVFNHYIKDQFGWIANKQSYLIPIILFGVVAIIFLASWFIEKIRRLIFIGIEKAVCIVSKGKF